MLAFASIALSRRVLWFPLWQQALHVLLLLASCQLLMLAVRMLSGSAFPVYSYFVGSVIAAALWPVAWFVLLIPQRQAEIVDENRPI